uniref:LRRCT domain-containing protein n=1 Tax=Anabas testudineus TaxID=64144 RepID=A0A7N6BG86_ANATE
MTSTLWLMLVYLTLPHLTCTDVCPSSCRCNSDGAVKCVGFTITDIPKHLPLHTYLLQLNGTNMNIINDQSLANKTLLLRFSLSHSHLHTIHPQAFQVAPQLKSLKLSSNDLSTLPARVLSPLTSLEQLHLDGNQLETIKPDMFEGLDGLLELDLSRNKLTSLASDVFDGLTNLTFLNLGRNSISKLPTTIFHSLTELRKLMMYNNKLEVLEAGTFDKLVNLEELKMHHNQIASLPPKVFWSLRNLKILTLSFNRLQAVPERNQLMGYMPEMKIFYLFGTNLTTVPGNLFANMSGLLSLNLHLNDKLRELPSDLFCCLPNLKNLSLRANDLHYLHPQLLSSLTTLKILLLNNNKLKSLTLPGDIFLSNTVLRELTLSDNPWDCTCSIRGFARWIRQNEHVVTDKDDVMCHSPSYQILRTIGSLDDEEFNFCELQSYSQPLHTISTSVQTTVVPTTSTLCFAMLCQGTSCTPGATV